jgi:predicted esterase
MTILQVEDPTLHLPRIMCLHGGGTNARIFRAQCRVLKRHLQSHFRLCFADAPFPSQAGPDVISVYKDYGPFRRWLRWHPGHPEIDPEAAVNAIQESLLAATREDDGRGATGEWVGLLGFSQGAKMCASLLFHQQVRAAKLGASRAGTHYRFAVLLAGRGPLVSLDPGLVMTPALVDAAHLSSCPHFPDVRSPSAAHKEHVLHLPTIHVHGMRDLGLHLHRQLLEQYCEKGSTRLIQWDGDHRVPVKSKDVAAVVAQILDVAREVGVLSE